MLEGKWNPRFCRFQVVKHIRDSWIYIMHGACSKDGPNPFPSITGSVRSVASNISRQTGNQGTQRVICLELP